MYSSSFVCVPVYDGVSVCMHASLWFKCDYVFDLTNVLIKVLESIQAALKEATLYF